MEEKNHLVIYGINTKFFLNKDHKQVPVEQRCSCAAGQALGHTGVGSEVSMDGWNAVPDHERLSLGVGRSWGSHGRRFVGRRSG